MDPTVLVLKPSSLGDVVHTLPAVARFREARPNWRLSWLINPEWAPLLSGNPDIDEIVLFPRAQFRGPAGWRRAWRWARSEISPRRPNLALDFQGLLRTAVLARWSGARCVCGLDDAREGARWFYTRMTRVPSTAIHAVDRYLSLVDDLPDVGQTPVRFPLPEGEPVSAERSDFLRPGGFVLLHPFSRGEGKSLSAAATRSLCQALSGFARVVVVGKGSALDLPAHTKNVLTLLNATSLLQLVWLIRRAAFVVSVDSGPMHIAAAVTDRLLAIHGWSDPRRVGPYNKLARVWKSGQVRRAGDFTDAVAARGTSESLEKTFGPSDVDSVAALVRDAVDS